jgi:hypothetical protein
MSLLALDPFTRANSPNLGTNWTTVTGYSSLWGITGNTATPQVNGDAWSAYTGIAFPQDQWAEFTFNTVGVANASNHGEGPSVRINTATGQGYILCLTDANGSELLRRLTGPSDTLLKTDATNWSNGDKGGLLVVGDGVTAPCVLTLFRNYSALYSFTDSTPLTGGIPGIFYSSTATTMGTIASWRAGDPFSHSLLLGVA